MLKVECESCKAPYQVDERRVPPTGLKMRCPKCGHTFLVTDPSKGGAAAGAGAGPKPGGPVKKPTMVGVGALGASPAPPAASPPVPSPPAIAPSPDEDLALPAVKPVAPKAPPLARPVAKPVAPKPPPAVAAPPPPPVAAPPVAPPPAALPGLDDLDLPALVGEVGLPAPAAQRPAPGRPGAPRAPTKPGAHAFSFEVDLPGVPPAPNAPPPAQAFGAIDLPAAKPHGGGPGADLPMAKGGGGFGAIDLPSPKGFGGNDLPSPKGAGFADLPMVQNDLPLVGGGLPMPVHGSALPVPVQGGGLPMPVQGGGLPMPVAGGGLPAPKGGFGEIDLPSLQNDLPNAMGAQAHMPMPVSDDRLLPNRQGGPPPVSFGELDLPLVGGAPGGAPADLGGGGVSFGELDLPADPSVATSSPAPGASGAPGAPGGMAFGEVDLGGGDGAPVVGPPPATSAGTFAFQEASLDAGGPAPSMSRPSRNKSATYDGPPSKLPKILALVAVLIVGGGALLEMTPAGAFGRNYISDQIHASEYGKNAVAAADAARAKCAADTYAACSAAADELAEARRRAPRNRPLSAYAAFFEYSIGARFGGDGTRQARAKTFTGDVPPNTPYLAAANAAEIAVTGDWAKAMPAIDAAVAKEPKDGVQSDLALLRGEGALATKDAATALAAFDESLKTAPTARAQFGVARAQYLAKSLQKAKDAVDATLKLSPAHAGARTMRAMLLWEIQRDDTAALKELDAVLDAKARKTEGSSEVSMALATKGWIMLARDRAGDARAAFDEAVKVDPRNVSALVGQGEVLYADSRFTEALTRFDEATKKDPTSIPAIIGAAKTRISLEQLKDAKTQLSAARQKAPKDMGLALWLAKAEEALGNKSVAEKLYNTAVDLADPQNPDAIQAYAAIASFLAAEGKTVEAQAKLDQARSKLPDTAALQRAFGEVAAAQGHFDEALGHFQSALQKNPNDIGTRFRLGVTYRHMGKLDLAAQELDKVAAIDREYPGIALERGVIFEKSGDVQKALEQFESAHQKAPNDLDLALRVGAAYVAIGKVDEGLKLLLKVHQQRPNSAEANHFIGRAYLAQGGLESAAAMRYLQRAVELDPNHAEYHLYVAWAANEANPAQLGLARSAIDKALQLDKLLADAYWQRGVVERREGAVNDAIKDLRRALELKPGRTEAHASLAEAYQDRNETANALAEWAKAIAGDEKQPMWRYRYGKLLLEKGSAAEAAKHLAYAVDAGKTTQPRPGWLGPAAFAAGEALRKVGQKHESADAYRLYLELSPPSAPDRRDATRGLELDGEPYEQR
jgi:predicted Zn finger-like uncharacterized protein